jgi:hypothetical protein
MRVKIWCLVAVVGLALVLAPQVAAEDPQLVIVPQEESADSGLDYTPAETTEAEPRLLLAPGDAAPVAPKPKPCRTCAPTYNGFPRISCDPCCYANDIGIPICTS